MHFSDVAEEVTDDHSGIGIHYLERRPRGLRRALVKEGQEDFKRGKGGETAFGHFVPPSFLAA